VDSAPIIFRAGKRRSVECWRIWSSVRIPLSSIDLTGLELGYAQDALASGYISGSGAYVERAENALAGFCGATGCLCVCNGTAALQLALMCQGVGPGDEVIVPGMTFVSPAAAVVRMGAIPVIADVEEVSWCLSPVEVERLSTRKTRGIIAVDVLGHPADFDALAAVCASKGLFLVEDAAEAHGSEYKARRTGGLGDVSVFSFFANKTLACGEGGALLSPDRELLARGAVARNHGMSRERLYWHEGIGDNFRLSNLHAAILLGQIERAESIVAKKLRVAQLYRDGLADCEGLAFRPSATWARVVPWLEPLRVLSDSGLSRDSLVLALRAQGVDARPMWTPLVRLPAFERFRRPETASTPLAERLLDELLWLPTSAVMTDADVDYVVDAVRRAVRTRKRSAGRVSAHPSGLARVGGVAE
jgi:perosamine synthetase